jgi:N-acetylglucosamine-6-phosphate deacetylase
MQEVPVKIMTLAPEIDEGINLIKYLIKNNIMPQIGHSLADLNTCKLALKNGVNSFTHLYNAMSGFDHRKPGVVAAAFSQATYSEIICDLVHVNEEMIKLASKNINKIYSITDCVSGSGMPDGEYKLGICKIIKKDGVVRLNDGTLGGSIATMDRTFKNLINIGFSLQDSVKMTSTNACEYMGYNNMGSLMKDYKANILNLDMNYNLKEVFLNGNKLR